MKKNVFHSFAFALVACCLLGSCKKSADAVVPVVPKEYDSAKFLTLVNALRKAGCTCGSGTDTKAMPAVRPAVWNDLLEKAALLHSEDMVANNYFSHTSKDGRELDTRVKAVGYKYSGLAEAVGAGQTSEEDFIQSVQGSRGHCEGMMSKDWYEIGIARKGNKWTYVMATPAK